MGIHWGNICEMLRSVDECPLSSVDEWTIIPDEGTEKLREVRFLVPRHTARKWQTQDLNSHRFKPKVHASAQAAPDT